MLPGNRHLPIKSLSAIGGALALLFLDQLLKYFTLEFGSATINPGVAFGFGSSGLLLVGVILLVALFWSNTRLRLPLVVICLASLSNIVDRMRVGGVIDYIPLGPVQINLADSIIVCIVATVLYYMITKKEA